jgi:uncharacterized delta-60 repeat protein
MSRPAPRPRRSRAHAPANPLRRATASVVESLENRRLLAAAGSVDYSFTDGFSTSGDEIVTAVARDAASGKVVVAGTHATTSSALLARFNADGTLDTTFDADGKVVLPLPAGARFDALTVAADETIYAAGTLGGDGLVVRVSAGGTLGSATSVEFGGANDSLAAIALDPDNNVIAVAGQTDASGDPTIAVAKLSTTGALTWTGVAPDTDFDSARAAAVAFVNGAVVAGGNSTQDTLTSFTVAKFDGLTGAAVPAFGVDGVVVTSFAADSSVAALGATAGGDVVAIGNSAGVALAQYDSAGVAVTRTDPLQANEAVTGGGVVGGQIYVTARLSDGGGVLRPGAIRYASLTAPRDASYGAAGVALSNIGLVQPSGQGLFHVATVDGTGTVTAAYASPVPLQGLDLTAGTIAPNSAASPVGSAHFVVGTWDEATAVHVDGQGHVLLAGRTVTGNALLYRRLASGLADPEFGASGAIEIDFGTGGGDSVTSIATDASNRILVGGYSPNGEPVVARYLPDGTADAEFGVDGVAVIAFAGGDTLDVQYKVSVAADGDAVIVAGSVLTFDFGFDFFVARFDPTGAADNNFGTNGILVSDSAKLIDSNAAGRSDAVNALVVDDGAIYVGGSTLNGSATGHDFLVVKLNAATGAAEDGFGVNGVLTFHTGAADLVNALRLHADGRLYAALGGAPGASAGVAIINPATGALVEQHTAGPATTGGATDIAVDPAGRILLSATSDGGQAVVIRLLPSGTPDTNFDGDGAVQGNGVVTVAFAGGAPPATAVALGVAANGDVYVAGTTGFPSDIGFARLLGAATVVNPAPTNVAVSGPATVVAGAPAAFVGSYSDPGDTVTRTWQVINAASAVVANGTGDTFTWTPTAPGTYTVTFTATDSAAQSASASATLVVTAPPPTGPAVIVNGVLTVTGTGAANVVTVTGSGSGSGNTATVTVVVDGGAPQTFPAASFTSILVVGGAGNDWITVDAAVTKPAEIHGGDGSDVISGGSGNDLLFGDDDSAIPPAGNDILTGNAGHDVIVGGAGNDVIAGGSGRDVLIGGGGADWIVGNNDDDALVAGYTVHDADATALSQIRAAWLLPANYATRVNALRTTLLRPDVDVFDDGAVDLLVGGAGTDWFVVNNNGSPSTRDLILDRAPSERLTDVDLA